MIRFNVDKREIETKAFLSQIAKINNIQTHICVIFKINRYNIVLFGLLALAVRIIHVPLYMTFVYTTKVIECHVLLHDMTPSDRNIRQL